MGRQAGGISPPQTERTPRKDSQWSPAVWVISPEAEQASCTEKQSLQITHPKHTCTIYQLIYFALEKIVDLTNIDISIALEKWSIWLNDKTFNDQNK